MAKRVDAVGSVLNVVVPSGRSRVQLPVGAPNNLLISDSSPSIIH